MADSMITDVNLYNVCVLSCSQMRTPKKQKQNNHRHVAVLPAKHDLERLHTSRYRCVHREALYMTFMLFPTTGTATCLFRHFSEYVSMALTDTQRTFDKSHLSSYTQNCVLLHSVGLDFDTFRILVCTTLTNGLQSKD